MQSFKNYHEYTLVEHILSIGLNDKHDGEHYTRKIGGEDRTKVAMGHPKKT